MGGAVNKWWARVPLPALYALSGAVLGFVCLFLLSLSDRHIEELERIGDKQTEAVEKLADQQGLLLNQLAEANPKRPYFTQTLAKIYKTTGKTTYLSVSVQNNNIPAEGVVSHLLVLEESLDSKSNPLHSDRIESANPIGSGGTHSHHWGPVNVPQRTRPAFVVFLVRYTNALTDEMLSQALFLKFLGSSEDGTFIQQLFNASSDEKTKIERYLEKRGLSKL